ncbi:hypothetical protein B0H13DRAFT_2137155 [Mycena leptocephala]|nr:hypothetical protein B0H13DRAFT_2137155 [Mycena leptocephala]
MAPQRPHLPPEFLSRLLAEPWMPKDEKYLGVIPEFNAARVQFVTENTMKKKIFRQGESAINSIVLVPGFKGGFFEDVDEAKLERGAQPFSYQYTILHMAIDQTDPPAACELIRLGALIDAPNGRGQTPLLQALQRAWELHFFVKMVGKVMADPRGAGLSKLGFGLRQETAYERVRYIAITLIQQHADVNATTVDLRGRVVSSLHFAYDIEDWDLVALLLKHGAQCKPTPTCVDVEDGIMPQTGFPVGADAKGRFAALRAQTQGAARPPRLCPCFSGKPMSDCHSEALPYPDDFTCPCGSAKTSVKCCKTRNIDLREMWDEETKCIQPSSTFGSIISRTPQNRALLEQVEQDGEMELLAAEALAMRDHPFFPSVVADCVQEACRRGVVDPAFAFAHLQLLTFPWPQARKCSKYLCRQVQKMWNDVVDKYIASGVDSRPRFEIEAAAKIGVSLGAMCRVCEADSCTKMEGREIQKVSTCSRCQMVFYCGTTCQKRHWPTHKKVCGSENQIEQPLLSQLAMSEFIHTWDRERMRRILQEIATHKIA